MIDIIFILALVFIALLVGTYFLGSRNLMHILFGLMVWSSFSSLLIFAIGGLTIGQAPLITDEILSLPVHDRSNPLSQALILTAIVINLGMLLFTTVIIHKTGRKLGNDCIDLTEEE